MENTESKISFERSSPAFDVRLEEMMGGRDAGGELLQFTRGNLESMLPPAHAYFQPCFWNFGGSSSTNSLMNISRNGAIPTFGG